MLANKLVSDIDRTRCLVKNLGEKVSAEYVRAISPADRQDWTVCRQFMLTHYNRNDDSERSADRKKFAERDQREFETPDEYMDVLRMLRRQGFPADNTQPLPGETMSARELALQRRFIDGQYIRALRDHLTIHYVQEAQSRGWPLPYLVEYALRQTPQFTMNGRLIVEPPVVSDDTPMTTETETPLVPPAPGPSIVDRTFIPPRIAQFRMPISTEILNRAHDDPREIMTIQTQALRTGVRQPGLNPPHHMRGAFRAPQRTFRPLWPNNIQECNLCRRQGHIAATCPLSQNRQSFDPREPPDDTRPLAQFPPRLTTMTTSRLSTNLLPRIPMGQGHQEGQDMGSTRTPATNCLRCGRRSHITGCCATDSAAPESFRRYFDDGSPFPDQEMGQSEGHRRTITATRRSSTTSYGDNDNPPCGRCGGDDHNSALCAIPLAMPSDDPETVHRNMRCERCGHFGHLTRCCEAAEPPLVGVRNLARFVNLRPAHVDYANRAIDLNQGPFLLCRRCGQMDHVTRDCRESMGSRAQLLNTYPGTIAPSPPGQGSYPYRATMSEVPDALVTGPRTVTQTHHDAIPNRDVQHVTCMRCHQRGHTPPYCPVGRDGILQSRRDMLQDQQMGAVTLTTHPNRCQKCHLNGHNTSSCEIPQSMWQSVQSQVAESDAYQAVRGRAPTRQAIQDTRVECLQCNRPGHGVANCPLLRPNRHPTNPRRGTTGRLSTDDPGVDALSVTQLLQYIEQLTTDIEQLCIRHPGLYSDDPQLVQLLRQRNTCINSIIHVPGVLLDLTHGDPRGDLPDNPAGICHYPEGSN
jgi:hypothetical protein